MNIASIGIDIGPWISLKRIRRAANLSHDPKLRLGAIEPLAYGFFCYFLLAKLRVFFSDLTGHGRHLP
jgi:hypothetical protein